MDTKKLKETLELLICQLEKTESEIEKQHLKIELKKKTKHYELWQADMPIIIRVVEQSRIPDPRSQFF